MTDQRTTGSELIFYQTKDGRMLIQCRFEDETVWLTQKLMADSFRHVFPLPRVCESIRTDWSNIHAEEEVSS